jgi:hypothetical protein
VYLACQFAECLVTHGQLYSADDSEGSLCNCIAQAVILWKAVQLLHLAGKHAEAMEDVLDAAGAPAVVPLPPADPSSTPGQTLACSTSGESVLPEELGPAAATACLNQALCSCKDCAVCGRARGVCTTEAAELLHETILDVVAPAVTFLASAMLQVRVHMAET